MAQGNTYQNNLNWSASDAAEPSIRRDYNRPAAAAALPAYGSMANMPPAEPLVVEICLSPLLWSESFGMLVDG